MTAALIANFRALIFVSLSLGFVLDLHDISLEATFTTQLSLSTRNIQHITNFSTMSLDCLLEMSAARLISKQIVNLCH
jgi:hypothetical protein